MDGLAQNYQASACKLTSEKCSRDKKERGHKRKRITVVCVICHVYFVFNDKVPSFTKKILWKKKINVDDIGCFLITSGWLLSTPLFPSSGLPKIIAWCCLADAREIYTFQALGT